MGEETAKYRKRAVDHVIFPAVTPAEVTELGPLVFTRGEGIYLWDTEGKRYMDSMSSGVYAVLVRHSGRRYKGVLNIGTRPTFYAPRDREPSIEVHIFGFDERIYGHDLEVFFIERIRSEKRFSRREGLVRQIAMDKKRALAVLKRYAL